MTINIKLNFDGDHAIGLHPDANAVGFALHGVLQLDLYGINKIKLVHITKQMKTIDWSTDAKSR